MYSASRVDTVTGSRFRDCRGTEPQPFRPGMCPPLCARGREEEEAIRNLGGPPPPSFPPFPPSSPSSPSPSASLPSPQVGL